MGLYSVRPLMDASLFSANPSILVSYNLDAPEFALFKAVDKQVNIAARAQLKNLGLQLLTTQSNLPAKAPETIRLINQISISLLKWVGLLPEQPLLSQDHTQRLLFLAYPQIDRYYTTTIVQHAIQYVINLYTQQIRNKQIQPPSLLQTFQFLLDQSESMGKSRMTKDIQRALREQNKPWVSLETHSQNINCYQIGFGRQQKLMESTVLFDSSYLGVRVSSSKAKTHQFLSQLGFNVPYQTQVKSVKQACVIAEKIGFPVVLKSDIGTGGTLVYSELQNHSEVNEAFNNLQQEQKNIGLSAILLEKHITGNVYRMEVVAGDFFDAYEMIPAAVTGDGKHTIAELVEIENRRPARRAKTDIEGMLIPLKLGTAEILVLNKQGFTEDSIPVADQIVRLLSNSNWSTGGTFHNVTPQVHESNKRLVERIASALQIDMLGIDVITHDISKPFTDEELVVIEANHAPEIGSFYDEEEGKFIDISKRTIEKIAPNIRYGDVPIITLKTGLISRPTADLLCKVLNEAGFSAGQINEQGIKINGETWANRKQVDQQNPNLQLLGNKLVGAAVIERTARELANFGVGLGGCDVAVLTDLNNTQIKTQVWTEGINTQQIDKLLINSARTGAVIVVTDKNTLDNLMGEKYSGLFVVFTPQANVDKEMLNKGINYILPRLSDGGHQCIEVGFNGKNYKLELDQPTNEFMPQQLSLAVLLLVGIELERAVSLLQI